MYGSIILYEGKLSSVTVVSWSNWSFLTFIVALLGAGGMFFDVINIIENYYYISIYL
jgi:hypothetical protein